MKKPALPYITWGLIWDFKIKKEEISKFNPYLFITRLLSRISKLRTENWERRNPSCLNYYWIVEKENCSLHTSHRNHKGKRRKYNSIIRNELNSKKGEILNITPGRDKELKVSSNKGLTINKIINKVEYKEEK